MDSTVYTFTPDGEKTRVVHYVIQSRPFVSTDPGKPAWPTITTFVKDTMDYIGPFVICNGRLDKVLFNGGYVTFGSTDPAEQTYHYFSTDHQGNVRAVFNESGAIEQSIAYDPFGVVIPDLSTGMGIQPYLYNGKELDRVHGLDWYDYGARMYDVTLGRWTTVDPMCEKYYHVSPYAYCGNNPVNWIDPDGKDIYPAYLFETNGNDATGFAYVSSKKFIRAMTKFGKTTYGKNFIGSFLNKGEVQYGVKGTGKYSNFRFTIEQYNLPTVEEQYHALSNAYGRFLAKETDGKLNIVMQLDIKAQSEEQLIETITHELTIHGTKIDKIINSYNKGGIDAVNKIFNKDPGGKNEHRDLYNMNLNAPNVKNYIQTK